MAKEPASSSKAIEPHEVVSKFDASWSLAKKFHSRWERNYKLYNNMRVMRSYEGITDTFVPLAFSTVETLTSALCSGKPSIDFMPQDMYAYIQAYARTGKKPDLKALNAQFDYWWECDNWDLKTVKTVRSGFLYGTACEWVYLDGDKPRILNLNPRDAIIDPALTDPMQLQTNPKDYFTGRRYLTTKKALEAERVPDPDNPGKTMRRFKDLSKVQGGSTGSEKLDKDLKESMFLGASGDTSDSVEVIELKVGDRLISVANRTIEIENIEDKVGCHRLVIHRFIADESLIYGKAILDVIAKPQEYLNDLSNQSMDAVTDVLLPERELDPTYSDYLDKVESGAPGTVYPFTPGSLRTIDKGVVSPQAFAERQNIKNEIREATGADQIVQGVQASGDATATEINAQLNQAGQRFELYIRMLEREALSQRAKIVYKLMRTYLTDQQLVPTMSMDGPKFRVFDPSQFGDDYEPKIALEATVKSNKMRDQRKATEAYQILIQDPTNDLWEAKKVLYPKMFDISEEELDRIIGAEKPEAAAPAGPAPASPEAPLEGEVIPPVEDIGVAA